MSRDLSACFTSFTTGRISICKEIFPLKWRNYFIIHFPEGNYWGPGKLFHVYKEILNSLHSIINFSKGYIHILRISFAKIDQNIRVWFSFFHFLSYIYSYRYNNPNCLPGNLCTIYTIFVWKFRNSVGITRLPNKLNVCTFMHVNMYVCMCI